MCSLRHRFSVLWISVSLSFFFLFGLCCFKTELFFPLKLLNSTDRFTWRCKTKPPIHLSTRDQRWDNSWWEKYFIIFSIFINPLWPPKWDQGGPVLLAGTRCHKSQSITSYIIIISRPIIAENLIHVLISFYLRCQIISSPLCRTLCLTKTCSTCFSLLLLLLLLRVAK